MLPAMVWIGVTVLQPAAARAVQSPNRGFAIRLVDETADAHAQRCPAGDDRVANSTIGIGQPGTQCLKRDGGFSGELVETHVGTGADGQAVVLVALTPKGADQFAAMTRTNIGRTMAVVLDMKVISRGLIGGEMSGGKFQISGYYTDAEAYGLAAEMNAAASLTGRSHPR